MTTSTRSAKSNKPGKKPPDLHIPDLRIEGYRLFRELEIPKFGRVNLITGANTAGKTTLRRHSVWRMTS